MLSYFMCLKGSPFAALAMSHMMMLPPQLSFFKQPTYSEKLMNKADELLLRKSARFNPDRPCPFHCYDRLSYLVAYKLIPMMCREHRFEQAEMYLAQVVATLIEKGAYEDAAIITTQGIKAFNYYQYSPLKIASWVKGVVTGLQASFEKSMLGEPVARALETILIAWLEENVYYEKLDYASQLTHLMMNHPTSSHFPSRLIAILVARLRKEGLMLQAVEMCKNLIDTQLPRHPSWAFVLCYEQFDLFKQVLGSAGTCDYARALLGSFLEMPPAGWKAEGARWFQRNKQYYLALKQHYDEQSKLLAHPEIIHESLSYRTICKECCALENEQEAAQRGTTRLLGRAMSVVMLIVQEMMSDERCLEGQQYYASAYERFYRISRKQAAAMKQFIGHHTFTDNELELLKEHCLIIPPHALRVASHSTDTYMPDPVCVPEVHHQPLLTESLMLSPGLAHPDIMAGALPESAFAESAVANPDSFYSHGLSDVIVVRDEE